MADQSTNIFIGAGSGGANPQCLELKRTNRYGLIAASSVASSVGRQLSGQLLRGVLGGLFRGR